MAKVSAWDRVVLARKATRPKASDYIEAITDDFLELHGDRLFGDDKSIIGGIGTIENHVVTIIGQQKGKNTKENMECNFGMTNPEGYRKALRLMKQAEKFRKTCDYFYRYSWSISRNGSRGKRTTEKQLQEI